MLSLREAAAQLGCDVRTLARWMHQAGIMAAPCTHDARRHELTAEQVQRLRVHRDSLQVAAAAPLDAGALAELHAALADLARRVERLERAARMAPPSRVERPQGAEDARTPISVPQPARIAPERVTGASGLRRYTGDTLPDGWVSFSTWAEVHGLNGRAASGEIGHALPAPESGAWRRGPNTIKAAYSPEQHALAAAAAAGRWPGRFTRCPQCPPA